MHDINVAFFLAFKSLTREHTSTIALIIFILSLSFLNLLFISGILGGFSQAVVQQSIDTATSHIVIDPQEKPILKDSIPDQNVIRGEIQTIPGVLATTRHYQLSGTIGYDKLKNGKFKYVSPLIYGIDPQQEELVTTISKHMVMGSYLDGLRTDEIVIGADSTGGFGGDNPADLGGVNIGDKVQVTYSNGIVRNYFIKGVYKVGFYSPYSFINYKEAESILSQSNSASEILVKVDPTQNAMATYITKIKNIVPNLKVRSYLELLGGTGQIIVALNAIAFVVGVISIGVNAVTLFVLIYVNASTKRKQIGILKAIGIKQRIIIFSYIFQALVYSFCGVTVGMLLVFLLMYPSLKQHPLVLPLGNVSLTYSATGLIGSIIASLVAGFLAGYIPSWKVAKQNILEAIWG